MIRGSAGFLLAVLGVCVAPTALGAELPLAPRFTPLTVADGLPSSHVNALAEDAAGYLWIGTHDGLARYDGVDFTVYQHIVDDDTSMPANSVQVLHVDAQDRIWVGIEGGGVAVLDAQRKAFQRHSPAADPRFALDDVWAIASQADGVVWLGGYAGGLHRYDTRTDSLQIIRADPEHGGLPSDHILDLALAADGRLYIATTHGLAILHDGKFDAVPAFHVEGPAMVLSVAPQPDGSIWVGRRNGFEKLVDGRFQPVLARAEDQALLSAGVMVSMRDRHGGHWLGTRSGLRYLQDGRLFDLARFGAMATQEMVLDVLEDHEGGLWFAVRNVGLLRLSPDWPNFAVLRASGKEESGLRDNSIADVSVLGGGGIWFMHRDGVLERLSREGDIERFLEGGEATRPLHAGTAVLARADGRVWLGFSHGLGLFDPASGRYSEWSIDSERDPVLSGAVDMLMLDPEQRLWMSAYGGGLQWRESDGALRRSWKIGVDEGLPTGSIEAMSVGADGRPWLAGDFGVLHLDAAREKFVAVAGIEPGRLMGLVLSADDEFWVARLGALERYRVRDDHAERVERVDAALGMPAVEIGGLMRDAEGDIWFTSIRGLWRYAPDTRQLRHFGVGDGLPGEEFNVTPPLRADDGLMYALTTEGAVVFDPSRIRETQTEPRVVLQSLSVLRPDGRVALKPAESVQLDWSDREFTVTTRFISFAHAAANRYRFRMNGFDSQWVDVDSRGQRVFSQVPAGRYALDIVGGSDGGLWSAVPLRLVVDVQGPWWRSTWAYAAYLAMGLMALLLAVQAYRDRLARKHQFELAQRQREWAEHASEAKSHFLATMGHEIRTPMTGVLGMTELLLASPLDARQRGYAEAIQRSGGLMLRLVNEALDLARIEAGKLTLASAAFDVQSVLRQAEALMQPLAERKGLDLQSNIAEGAPSWVRGDAQRLQQIVLNLVGNAVKFTETGSVVLSLEDDARDVVISVRDSGPGLSPAQREQIFRRFEQAEGEQGTKGHGGSGLGLAICRELASAMGGSIEVESELGHGAKFQLRLPLERVPAPIADVSRIEPSTAVIRRILLVEDDPTVAQVVVGLLQAQGHQVRHASHGLAALGELRQMRFDLAVLDLDLPGIDGFELATLMKNEAFAPPMVALTARSDMADEERARRVGMVGFLRKPVQGRDLADAIASCVSGAAAGPPSSA
jgi:signal transduction histidine kinase/CheY-like chemotaxis protein/sugar lactone lactonase YvrE